MNPSVLNAQQRIALLCGALIAIAMAAMPPWRDLQVPPFGSSESFAGFSPAFWPPHDPWTFPAIADRPFWNSQHEYRINWSLLAIQLAMVGVITAAVTIALHRRPQVEEDSNQSAWSFAGAFFGGIAAAAIGLIGIMAIMAPLLEIMPEARVATTSFLLAVYLAAIVAGVIVGARVRFASLSKVLAGLCAGQVVAAYVVFAFLPDTSPESHRILLLVWAVATAVGAAVGLTLVKLTRSRI